MEVIDPKHKCTGIHVHTLLLLTYFSVILTFPIKDVHRTNVATRYNFCLILLCFIFTSVEVCKQKETS